MKLWLRIVLFLGGAGLLAYGWHKAHAQLVNLQSPANASTGGASETLVVLGGFVMLMAFAPSQELLGRWMSLKKPKKAHAAQFKRRRQHS